MHKVKNRKYLSLSVLLFFSMSLFFAPISYALELVISGNGSESNSEVKVQVENNVTVDQTNEVSVENSIDESVNTGQNSASGNSSDGVNIETGDITSVTSINTNLNTSTAEIGCCSSTETNLLITGNGNGSVNTIRLNQGKNINVNINNNADVLNSVNGSANTGENRANNNTGGNVSISTGSIKILNDINNDPVNISSVSVKKGIPGVSAVIKENGSGSVNIIETNLFDDVSIYLNHTANIKNDITWEANTGGNEASGNTGGDVNISTGDVELGVFIKNFVNIGSVDIDCCKDIYDPGDDPGDDEGNGGPSDEDKGKDDIKKEVQGIITPRAAATEAGGPGIIGLSDTSSQSAKLLFFWLSLIFVTMGGKIILEEIIPMTSNKKVYRRER